MGTLNVAGLSAGYGEQVVVRDFNLKIEPGEIVVLMGRNGVGKSTTLRGISGFLSGTTGTVSVDGNELHGAPYRRAAKGLGIVLEGRSVFPSLTVRKNFGVASSDIDPALEWFPELRPMLNRPAGTLSGGEQQMVAIGRALGKYPSVLLVDELSFGLAPIVYHRLLGLLKDVAAESSMAMLVVEQHFELALAVASRAVIMASGHVALELDGSELSSRADEIERLYLGASALEKKAS
jgi:branched-chain amino acid transport system ATP-binding protein